MSNIKQREKFDDYEMQDEYDFADGVRVEDKYTQQFQQFVKTLPKKAIKLTLIKDNLDEEIIKRVSEIKNNKVLTKPLSELSWLRDRYVQH